eukprot:2339885-Amphidinium_carterae.1
MRNPPPRTDNPKPPNFKKSQRSVKKSENVVFFATLRLGHVGNDAALAAVGLGAELEAHSGWKEEAKMTRARPT